MKKIFIAILIVFLVVFGCITGYFYYQEKSTADGKIVSGVKIAGRNVGNMSYGDAIKAISEREKTLLNNNIKIKNLISHLIFSF